jgi:AAA-like domain
MVVPIKVKFNEAVWHDKPYCHPQMEIQVERDFYDRDEKKARAETILRSPDGKPVFILGERRSGKTSMLKLLADHLSNDPSGQFVPIPIPWQGIRSHNELAEEIIQGICLGLDKELPNTLQLPRSSHQQDSTTIGEFIKVIRQLLTPVSSKIVVISIDEFDSILEEVAPTEKYEILRLTLTLAEMNDLPIRLLLTLSRIPEEGSYSQQLFSKSQPISLDPFMKEDLDDMVKGILGQPDYVSTQDLQRLFDLSGGWPYFAKLLLECLLNQQPDTRSLDLASEQAIKHTLVEQALNHIYMWHLSDSEKAMMLLLAKQGGHISAEEMSVVGVSLRTGIAELVRRGYVVKDDNDGSYRFRIGFLKEWFPRWVKFDEEVEKRLKELLLRIERLRDPWAGSIPITVANEDLDQYYF